MSTSSDIVRRALKRLGVLSAGEEMAAADGADGNAALNAMIASWQNDGVDISPDVPLPSRHEEGVVALLAVRLAPDYGMSAPDQVQIDASKGWDALLADYIRPPLSQFDSALTNMPSQGYWGGTGLPPLWQPQRAYTIGDRVQYRGRVYECTVGGVSGATLGPTGRSTALDGSVTWTFERVI